MISGQVNVAVIVNDDRIIYWTREYYTVTTDTILRPWILYSVEGNTPKDGGDDGLRGLLSYSPTAGPLNPKLAFNMCPRHNIKSVETFQKIKRLVTLSLPDRWQKTEAVLKTFEPFVYENIYYSSDSFCINVLKTAPI